MTKKCGNEVFDLKQSFRLLMFLVSWRISLKSSSYLPHDQIKKPYLSLSLCFFFPFRFKFSSLLTYGIFHIVNFTVKDVPSLEVRKCWDS